MLYSTKTPAQKRIDLHAALNSGKLLQFPGAFNPLSARLIERHGFDGVYLSGAVMAADLGLPDIGLTTLTEVATRANQISRMTDLPTLVDVDTGFGEPLNLARTVQELEAAGAAAIHIEDQVNPKRCGHLDGKSVVGLEDAVKRIAAAVSSRGDQNLVIMARTDVRGVEGMQAAIDRVKALEGAGADAIFPEAMATLEEFEQIRKATSLPILANMTEFGKSELFTKQQLESIGINLVIYPVSLLRVSMGASARALQALSETGSMQSEVALMQTRSDLYDLIDYPGYNKFDEGIFNFKLSSEQ
jgi:methylisocitrate lyase